MKNCSTFRRLQSKHSVTGLQCPSAAHIERERPNTILLTSTCSVKLQCARLLTTLPTPQPLQIPDEWEGYELNLFSIPNHYRDDLDKILLPAGIIHDRCVLCSERDFFLMCSRETQLVRLIAMLTRHTFYSLAAHSVQKMARDIVADAQSRPLTCLCVLKVQAQHSGAFFQCPILVASLNVARFISSGRTPVFCRSLQRDQGSERLQ